MSVANKQCTLFFREAVFLCEQVVAHKCTNYDVLDMAHRVLTFLKAFQNVHSWLHTYDIKVQNIFVFNDRKAVGRYNFALVL